jgi:hypothetical protein
MSPLALIASAALGTGWCWQYRADARAAREEHRTLREVVAAQYIRLRDTADVRHDWSARAIAVGLRSQVLLLRDERDHWERQLARLEGRPLRAFRSSSLPPPIDGDVRLMVDGQDADTEVEGALKHGGSIVSNFIGTLVGILVGGLISGRQERLDFAERLLAQGAESRRVGPER